MANEQVAKNMPEGYVGLAHIARDATPPDYQKAFSLYHDFD